ncbi:TRM11 family SAM-dependent methyltransferase [Agaribacterium haliotis]|uniref:TRM11 family SAM-dependent methyltransferase n=1 Tax=Agaribacterium haliotis TaxID=2013869 RepID=UPI000BB53E11|nr:hypothetical protein [Agaribacterium haliotis]
MTDIAIQISPEARSAYFADYREVARAEIEQIVPEAEFELLSYGDLNFFSTAKTASLPLNLLQRLSFAQGLYDRDGDLFRPLALEHSYALHEDFVFGSKFKGKTNERLTQLLINLALAELQRSPGDKIKLLDPMCGRATSLLWAMRYGLQARGIEQDNKALEDVRRNIKKWCKIHRQKHQLNEGCIGKRKRGGEGSFLEFSAEQQRMQLLIGDARNAPELLKNEKFDILLSDLPYGVQHMAAESSRNPLAVLETCASAWLHCIKNDGVLVLAFNKLNPKRKALIDVFEAAGWQALSFSAAHRMSESIVRDIVILKPALGKAA